MNKTLVSLIIIVALTLFFRLGTWGVTETSEARYSEISREMTVNHDYIHPDLLNIHHYHKPPLTYIITSFAYQIFGVSSFGSRFFLVVALLLQVLIVYQLAQNLYPKQEDIGLLSALIYISLPLVLFASRNLTTDAFLTTFVLASIWSYTKYALNGHYRFLYLLSILMGLGFLIKGPLILLFVLPYIIGYNWFNSIPYKISLPIIGAVFLFLVIGLSWYLLLIKQNPDFYDYFIGDQTVDRIATNKFHRNKPWWYYIVYGTLSTMPWLPIFLMSIRQKQLKALNANSKAMHFAIILPFLVLNLVHSKLIFYLLPLFGLSTILLAHFLSNVTNDNNIKLIERFSIGYYALFAIALITLPFFTIKNVTISPLHAIFGALILFCLYMISRQRHYNRIIKIGVMAMSSILLLFMSSTFFFSQNQIAINSTKPITDFLTEHNLANRRILLYNVQLPSVAFNLQKDIYIINHGHPDIQRDTFFEQNNNWQQYYYIEESEPKSKLDSMLSVPTVLIMKRSKHNVAKDYMAQLQGRYSNSKQFGKYSIFY